MKSQFLRVLVGVGIFSLIFPPQIFAYDLFTEIEERNSSIVMDVYRLLPAVAIGDDQPEPLLGEDEEGVRRFVMHGKDPVALKVGQDERLVTMRVPKDVGRGIVVSVGDVLRWQEGEPIVYRGTFERDVLENVDQETWEDILPKFACSPEANLIRDLRNEAWGSELPACMRDNQLAGNGEMVVAGGIIVALAALGMAASGAFVRPVSSIQIQGDPVKDLMMGAGSLVTTPFRALGDLISSHPQQALPPEFTATPSSFTYGAGFGTTPDSQISADADRIREWLPGMIGEQALPGETPGDTFRRLKESGNFGEWGKAFDEAFRRAFPGETPPDGGEGQGEETASEMVSIESAWGLANPLPVTNNDLGRIGGLDPSGLHVPPGLVGVPKIPEGGEVRGDPRLGGPPPAGTAHGGGLSGRIGKALKKIFAGKKSSQPPKGSGGITPSNG